MMEFTDEDSRGVPIWVFLHVPMSDNSTKNNDNRYSLPIFLLVIKQKWLPFNNMWSYTPCLQW